MISYASSASFCVTSRHFCGCQSAAQRKPCVFTGRPCVSGDPWAHPCVQEMLLFLEREHVPHMGAPRGGPMGPPRGHFTAAPLSRSYGRVSRRATPTMRELCSTFWGGWGTKMTLFQKHRPRAVSYTNLTITKI